MANKHDIIHSQYTAQSKDDLLKHLDENTVKVPLRGVGRKPWHCEKRTISLLLRVWADSSFLQYPIELTHRDKPDFLLCFNRHRFGIECSEAVSKNEASIDALANRKGLQSMYFLDNFHPDEVEMTAAEKEKILSCSGTPGNGWIDDQAEKEWVQWMMKSIAKKTGKFVKPNFEKYDHNYLLIYDNSPPPIDDIKDATALLVEALKNYWNEKVRYNKIFIESEYHIIELDSSNYKFYSVADVV